MKAKSISHPAAGDPSLRKRKAHRKSRSGCRNCKLRRVKCAEERPSCEKCLQFGVLCNYAPNVPDLQPISAPAAVVDMSAEIERSPFSTREPVLDMMNLSLPGVSSASWRKLAMIRFDEFDLARLDKFQRRTVLTMGNEHTTRLFQREMVPLAFSHRFLMHLILSVTACHDRYLSGVATSKQSVAEAYHTYHAVMVFQEMLARPIHDNDRDSLLLAATMLGIIAFFNLEASSVKDVWPFKHCSLGWLNLSDGKKAVWRLVTPLCKDSIWQPLSEIYDSRPCQQATKAERKPSIFSHLCSEDDSSPAAAANPYHRSARYLGTLLDLECNDATLVSFLGFTCTIDPAFKSLLEHRDPWALLMLAYWYMKFCRGAWWVSSRSILQGQAICLYLELYHADDEAIQAALTYPRIEFEAAQREGWGGMSAAVSGIR